MLETTLDLVRSALRVDPTLTPRDRTRLVALLRDGGQQKPDPALQFANERIVRREECAQLIGGSLRLVDRLASQGTLPRVTLPGRRRAMGFRLSDVTALIASHKGA